MASDAYTELRRRVLRRVVYALNTAALLEGRVPPEGPYDAAAANGLAAIIAAEMPGSEWGKSGRVLAPRGLLGVVKAAAEASQPWACGIDHELIEEGIDLTQPFRHGRAADEWVKVTRRHIEALAELDAHESLQCIAQVAGRTFDEAVVLGFLEEAEALLPGDPKERSIVPDPEECGYCGRMTLISEGWDGLGVGIGVGQCLACGEERVHDDVVADMLAWRLAWGD